MALILSLDTSTSICSAALHRNGKPIAVNEVHEEQTHGARLAVIIDHLFKSSNLLPSDLNAVALTSGPGSYTGLRIGVSTAKGLAMSRRIPLIAIDALTVLALSVSRQDAHQGSLLCPMLDARRMEVYCAVFDHQMKLVQPIQAKVIEPESFADLLSANKLLFFGNGAEKCKSILQHPSAHFIRNVYPSAAHLGELAYQKYLSSAFEDLISFEPLYLKEFLTKQSTKNLL